MDPVIGPVEILIFLLITFAIPAIVIFSDNKASH